MNRRVCYRGFVGLLGLLFAANVGTAFAVVDLADSPDNGDSSDGTGSSFRTSVGTGSGVGTGDGAAISVGPGVGTVKREASPWLNDVVTAFSSIIPAGNGNASTDESRRFLNRNNNNNNNNDDGESDSPRDYGTFDDYSFDSNGTATEDYFPANGQFIRVRSSGAGSDITSLNLYPLWDIVALVVLVSGRWLDDQAPLARQSSSTQCDETRETRFASIFSHVHYMSPTLLQSYITTCVGISFKNRLVTQ